MPRSRNLDAAQQVAVILDLTSFPSWKDCSPSFEAEDSQTTTQPSFSRSG